MTVKDVNQTYCDFIIQLLKQAGFKDFCIAPGSRSAPLAIAAQNQADIHVHFDERGLGFYALGLAKSGRPAVVICTSGTAVANLIPSAIEAFQSGQRIVFLTADRPIELIDVGANQAINQQGLLQPNICQEVQIAAPISHQDITHALSSIAPALTHSGPVHVNLALREPLYGQGAKLTEAPRLPELNPPASLPEIRPLALTGRCLIVAGELSINEARAVNSLAQSTGCKILADVNSQLTANRSVVHAGDLLAKAHQLEHVDSVIQFGGRIVSKALNSWLGETNFKHYYLIRSHYQNLDPSGKAEQIHGDIALACQQLAKQRFDTADICLNSIERFQAYTSQQNFGELRACKQLLETLTKPWQLFVGNSLPIRLVDQLTPRNIQIYSNRGASGIDGLIATAAGLAASAATVLLVGDTSALHDLNSLALARDKQLVIVILNNNGGNIFDLLPPSGQPYQSQLFTMPHGTNFSSAASLFGLGYHACHTSQDFQLALDAALIETNTAQVIEVIAKPYQATTQLKAYKHG